ncbi:hypothetical protein PG993_005448 [Apiospora rasikravindrae]|uniref:Serine hydrolase domain-containing protein n=1 Tax=Apiospora rasikravindrae TaxID=990691 RepID=A0ABR1TI40_9PEZI
MKFLCLHGMGANSDVYEIQMASIRAKLDSAHEFFFVDGPIECDPAEGVDRVSSGPFLCYYDKPVQERLQRAFDLLDDVIREDGPFDGIFGFSQGGALAASFLLHHREMHPHDPEPFQLAIFMGATLPFDPQSQTRANQYVTSISPQNGAVSVRDWNSEDLVEPLPINGLIAPPAPGDGILRLYHPEREAARITIPTVHIMGTQDPFYPQSVVLSQLCSGHVDVVEHQEGHILPRNYSFTRQVAVSIEQCIQRALFKC